MVRLAEILGPLSMATDMSAGNPPGTSMSATVVAVRIGQKLGFSESNRSSLVYAGLLRFSVCTSTSSETAEIALGDELSGYLALSRADPADPVSVRAELETVFAPDRPMEEKRALIDRIVDLSITSSTSDPWSPSSSTASAVPPPEKNILFIAIIIV